MPRRHGAARHERARQVSMRNHGAMNTSDASERRFACLSNMSFNETPYAIRFRYMREGEAC